MLKSVAGLFSESSTTLRNKVIGIYIVLLTFNIGAWVWALVAFRGQPVLLGTALLAYTFGLRHAVDLVCAGLFLLLGDPLGLLNCVGCFHVAFLHLAPSRA